MTTYDASDIDNILQVWDGDELRWRFTPEQLRRHIRFETDIELAKAMSLGLEIMMSYYPSAKPVVTPNGEKVDVKNLKARLDIVEVVGRYTQLKKSGSRFIAKCPQHESVGLPLVIYPEDQGYHCFHCGIHGDVIKAVMTFEQLDFKTAIGVLNGH